LKAKYDVAIVGSGFSGSLLAMIACRLGRSVVLIEKGKHPRVVIGESSTPLTNLLFEELTTRYNLPKLRPLAKWGTWQEAYPEVACGLKRGFTFYHHLLNHPDMNLPARNNQLLVAASPNDTIADTHWYRADFDQLLVREAQSLGVEYLDETNISSMTELDSEVALQGTRMGCSIHICAKFLVDATGPRGFLHHTMKLGERELPGFPPTQALYNHFRGVGRLRDHLSDVNAEPPPYPVDDAAVHHVFDGGWIWVLQFNNGITSAGIAATDALARHRNFIDGETAWLRLLDSIPVLQRQFGQAKAERAFTHIPRLSFRSASVAGERWALLPSAAGFVDPLLSTGFPLTLLGLGRLTEIIEHQWDSGSFVKSLREYSTQTEGDLLAAAELIGALYASMDDFSLFSTLSLLYFAAVSFSEMARRLGKPFLAPSFLLRENPAFGLAARNIFSGVRGGIKKAAIADDILRTIEPFNLAGFGEPHRRNWYPVDPEDLFRNREKLESSHESIANLLRRCGFQL
jgi:tetracycline 7-halogenase / FADH2 O2-dependent halogenase